MHLLHQHRLPTVWLLSLACGLVLTGCHTRQAHKGGWPRVEILETRPSAQISAQVVNIGNEPLRLWEFGVRGGWDTLSVLVRDPYTGQRLRLRRLLKAFKGPNLNPAVFVKNIEPGQSYRFEIDLHDGTWERRRECDLELYVWDLRLDLDIPSKPIRLPMSETPKELGFFCGKVNGEWYRCKDR